MITLHVVSYESVKGSESEKEEVCVVYKVYKEEIRKSRLLK